MSETVTMSRAELDRRLVDAYRFGMLAQRLCDELADDDRRPNLHIVPTDKPTAQILHLPTNDNSAA